MAGRNEVRAGKAYVEIALKDKVQGGLRRVATRLRAFGSTVGAIGAGLAGAGTAIAGPLAWATKTFAGFQDQMLAVRSVKRKTLKCCVDDSARSVYCAVCERDFAKEVRQAKKAVSRHAALQ